MSWRAIYKVILVIICLHYAKAQIDFPDDEGPLDVYFLADNTGSMRAEITEVREQARFIFDDIAVRATSDVRFGVGAYKDFGDNFVFKNLLSLTKENLEVPLEQDPIIKGMKLWEASGGGDEEEAQHYAMVKIARDQYQEIGWRPDAVKMLAWFGDASGKDPASRINRVPITEKFATDLLKKAEILVIALDVKNLNKSGQAERIAEATGGGYVFVDRDRSQGQGSPPPTPPPLPASPFPSHSPYTLYASPVLSSTLKGRPVTKQGKNGTTDVDLQDLWPTDLGPPNRTIILPPDDTFAHKIPPPGSRSFEVKPRKDKSVAVSGSPPKKGIAKAISDQVSGLFSSSKFD